MSVLLTTPGVLLAVPAWRDRRRRGWSAGRAAGDRARSVANLMHFSQGWVQFGYRFSNDIVPFALVLVAIGSLVADPTGRALGHAARGRADRPVRRRSTRGAFVGPILGW